MWWRAYVAHATPSGSRSADGRSSSRRSSSSSVTTHGACEPDLQWGMDRFEASECAEKRCKNKARPFLFGVRLGCISIFPAHMRTNAEPCHARYSRSNFPGIPVSGSLAFAGVVVAFAVWRAYVASQGPGSRRRL